MKHKKFLSSNKWFELTYPTHWTLFEEEDGTYLFLDNDNWKGNFRISAIRLQTDDKDSKEQFFRNHLNRELAKNKTYNLVMLGDKNAVYYVKDLEQEGELLEIHHWTTGGKTTLLICSFTMDKNRISEKEVKKEYDFALETLKSIKILE